MLHVGPRARKRRSTDNDKFVLAHCVTRLATCFLFVPRTPRGIFRPVSRASRVSSIRPSSRYHNPLRLVVKLDARVKSIATSRHARPLVRPFHRYRRSKYIDTKLPSRDELTSRDPPATRCESTNPRRTTVSWNRTSSK